MLGDTRRAIVDVLEFIYGPVLFTVGFCLFFAVTDPALEVLIGYLADVAANREAEGAFWVFEPKLMAQVMLFVMPILTHLCAVGIIARCQPTTHVAARVIPTLIPIAFFLAYVVGFRSAINSPEAAFYGFTWRDFPWLPVVGVLLYIICAIWTKWVFANALNNMMSGMQGLVGLAAVFLLQLLAISYFGFIEPDSARIAGPIAVTAGFIVFATCFVSAATVFSHRMPGHFPIILIVIAFLFASTDLRISIGLMGASVVGIILTRIYAPSRKKRGYVVFGASGLLAAVYALGFWQIPECQTLAGCNLLTGQPPAKDRLLTAAEIPPGLPERPEGTPMRIVAAQGGGLYAAYHTAYDLAYRADTEDNFGDSLIAISGVSGGSVGAGVYWAVHNSGVCPKTGTDRTCYRDAVDEILSKDYLTPSLATMLFRDMLDTILPVSALWHVLGWGPIDRGSVLEKEIRLGTAQWLEAKGVAKTNPLAMPISASSHLLPGFQKGSPGDPLALPLLLLNGTRVDDGSKVLVSPLATLRGRPSNIQTATGQDLSIVSGMVVSARFPVVTPPARLRTLVGGREQTVQLVDGGYFDNSGIETAVDLVLDLRAAGVSDPIELIVFTADEKPGEIRMKGTIAAPVGAFAGAWRARRDQSEIRIGDLINVTAGGPTLDYCVATTVPSQINFTLSWYLSRATFDFIQQEVTHQYTTPGATDDPGRRC